MSEQKAFEVYDPSWDTKRNYGVYIADSATAALLAVQAEVMSWGYETENVNAITVKEMDMAEEVTILCDPYSSSDCYTKTVAEWIDEFRAQAGWLYTREY